MTAAIFTRSESSPYWVIMSATIAAEPEPVSGRRMAMGITSAGTPMSVVMGPRMVTKASMAPLARNIAIANRIATRYGMIRTATSNPSFAPPTNDS
jgi:hypothetical protein